MPFSNMESITEKYFLKISGWSKSDFVRFCKYISSINNTLNRSKEELVAIYRWWLKKGLDQTLHMNHVIALHMNNTTQQQISHYLMTIRKAIHNDFVEHFLGANR